MAPHITLWIVARGLNCGLATRLNYEDEAKANAEDPVLRSIEPPGRRQTLIARREMRDGLISHVMDIHLQGQNETVFFDV